MRAVSAALAAHLWRDKSRPTKEYPDTHTPRPTTHD